MSNDFQDLIQEWKSDTHSLSAFKQEIEKEKNKMKKTILIETGAGILVVAFWAVQLLSHPDMKTLAMAGATGIFLLCYYLGIGKSMKGNWKPYGESIQDYIALSTRRLQSNIQWSTYLTKISLGFGVACTGIYAWLAMDLFQTLPTDGLSKRLGILVFSFACFWGILLSVLTYVNKKARQAEQELENLKTLELPA